MTRETRISPDTLIYPLFVREGKGVAEELPSLPGQIRYSPDTLAKGVDTALSAGVRSFLLFGIPELKDENGSGAFDENGVVQQALKNVRKSFGKNVFLITDVCLCEYTSHGHCGLIKDNTVDNDSTLPLLVKTALSHIRVGSDMVAPSGMMDGTVAALRTALDANGFASIPIMSYAAKYASAFYGPFRDAAGSTPQFGDRKTYQMDYHNGREALKRIHADINEGADIIIVKPALPCLDIVSKAREQIRLPIAAYSVSGEYAMVKAAAASGFMDEYKVMCESAVGIFRAGADILITYFAKELAGAIQKGDIG
jgi:porphobilinogen synthase